MSVQNERLKNYLNYKIYELGVEMDRIIDSCESVVDDFPDHGVARITDYAHEKMMQFLEIKKQLSKIK